MSFLTTQLIIPLSVPLFVIFSVTNVLIPNSSSFTIITGYPKESMFKFIV